MPKISLNVTFEWDEEAAALEMTVTQEGKTLLGQLRLMGAARGVNPTILRENRDALAGVFLSSFDAAVSGERRTLNAKLGRQER